MVLSFRGKGAGRGSTRRRSSPRHRRAASRAHRGTVGASSRTRRGWQRHSSASLRVCVQPCSSASAKKSARGRPRIFSAAKLERVADTTASAILRNGTQAISFGIAATGNAVPSTDALGSPLTYPCHHCTKPSGVRPSASASRSALTHGSTLAPMTSRCVVHGQASGQLASRARHGFSAMYRSCRSSASRSSTARAFTSLARPITPQRRPSCPSSRVKRSIAAPGSVIAGNTCG